MELEYIKKADNKELVNILIDMIIGLDYYLTEEERKEYRKEYEYDFSIIDLVNFIDDKFNDGERRN